MKYRLAKEKIFITVTEAILKSYAKPSIFLLKNPKKKKIVYSKRNTGRFPNRGELLTLI